MRRRPWSPAPAPTVPPRYRLQAAATQGLAAHPHATHSPAHPTVFLIAVIFAPIGAVLLLASNGVSQITLEYTGCERATGESTDLPKWTYDLKSSNAKLSHATPQWQYDAGTKTCNVRFELPADLGKPVFLYYKLTNFYRNQGGSGSKRMTPGRFWLQGRRGVTHPPMISHIGYISDPIPFRDTISVDRSVLRAC